MKKYKELYLTVEEYRHFQNKGSIPQNIVFPLTIGFSMVFLRFFVLGISFLAVFGLYTATGDVYSLWGVPRVA